MPPDVIFEPPFPSLMPLLPAIRDSLDPGPWEEPSLQVAITSFTSSRTPPPSRLLVLPQPLMTYILGPLRVQPHIITASRPHPHMSLSCLTPFPASATHDPRLQPPSQFSGSRPYGLTPPPSHLAVPQPLMIHVLGPRTVQRLASFQPRASSPVRSLPSANLRVRRQNIRGFLDKP